jgi:hypothetical protein
MPHHRRIRIYKLSVFEDVFDSVNQRLPKRVIKILMPNKKNKPMNINTTNISKITNKEITSENKMLSAPENFNKEELIKKINSYLNKLTDKNFEVMNANIISLLNSEFVIKNTIDFILDKAISQHTFIKLYAKILNNISMTNNLHNIYENYFDAHILKLNNDDFINDSSYDLFCRYLNNKDKLIGLFLLLIELYNIENVSSNMIEKYISLLLKLIDDSVDNNLVETYTECLCKTICSLTSNFYEKYTDKLNQYKTDKNKFKPRMRFMIMDVNDFFKN